MAYGAPPDPAISTPRRAVLRKKPQPQNHSHKAIQGDNATGADILSPGLIISSSGRIRGISKSNNKRVYCRVCMYLSLIYPVCVCGWVSFEILF